MLRQQQQQQQLQQQQTTTISRRNHSANYQLTWQFGSNIFYSCCVWNIISCDNTIMCHAPEPTSLVWRQPSWTVVWQDKRGISKLGLWNSLCTTEPTLLEVIKWLSKVHYAHIITLVRQKKARFDSKMHGSTEKSPVRQKNARFDRKMPSPECISWHCHYQTSPPPPLLWEIFFSNFFPIFF